jgi:neutral amino acid transport system substrate-binding protein
MYQEGSYGKDVSAAVAASAGQAGLEVAVTAGFKPGEAGSAAAAVDKANADAVIVIARDGAQGALAELGNAGVDGKRIILSDGAFARYGSACRRSPSRAAAPWLPGSFPRLTSRPGCSPWIRA